MTGQVVSDIVGLVLLLAFFAAVAWVRVRFRGFSARWRAAVERGQAAARRARGELLDGSDAEAIASSRPTAGLAAIRAHDPAFDEHELLAGAESTMARLVDAIARQRLDLIRPLVADRLFETSSMIVAGERRRKWKKTPDRIRFADVRIVGAHRDDHVETVTVRLAQIVEATAVKDGRSRTRHSASAALQDVVFQRAASARRSPSGGLLAQRCPSCQAPLDVDLDGRCRHCRHAVMNGAFDWVMTRWDVPGEGVGPPPTEEELAAVGAATAASKAATTQVAPQLQAPETIAVNETGRVTADQHHALVKAARAPLRNALGAAIVSVYRVLFFAVVAIVLFRLMKEADDPWLRTLTIAGQTRTLPLLHLLPVGLGALTVVLLLKDLAAVPAPLVTWIRAHGGACAVDGRVAFIDGGYGVVAGPQSRRPLVPWQATASAVRGLVPGPCRVFVGPGDSLLSFRPTGDEATRLASLQEALAFATGCGPATLQEAQRQVATGAASVMEGYVTASPGVAWDGARVHLHGHPIRVSATAAAALVEGVWYRVHVRNADFLLLHIEALPAERATSAAVDPNALTGGTEAIRAHDLAFDDATFLARVTQTYRLVQDAWCRLDPTVSRGVMGDTIWRAHARQIEDRRARGRRPVLERLAVTGVGIRSAERTSAWDTIVVRVAASAAEYDLAVDSAGHEHIVRGDRTVRGWQEDWVFHRSANAVTQGSGGMLAQRCPHCQAPLALDESGVCGWCRVPIMTGVYDWVVTRIDRTVGTGGNVPPGGGADAGRPDALSTPAQGGHQ